MKKKAKDWLLSKTLPEQNTMFGNVEVKIDNYAPDFGLTPAWVTDVKLICQTFQAAYTGVMENRATAKQMDKWFDGLLKVKTHKTAPDSPIFLQITLPAGAQEGLYQAFRDKMDFFKSNEAYTRAIGEDLMIVAAEGDEVDTTNAMPELSVSVDVNGAVSATYKKGAFGGLELQWREAGAAMWQLADKSSEKTITFTPEGITLPAKIELRGVYLLKNQRVGQWSPNYSLTLG